jgi:16S rRNA (cytidine1402-2'-O)-methyltransferase
MTVIPGPSAFVNALVLSGKPAHEFFFAGFLPPRSGARRNRLKALARLKCTVILYESCHRLLSSLADILAVFGEREICCARELTKKFEEVQRAKISQIIRHFQQTKPRGEFVIVI